MALRFRLVELKHELQVHISDGDLISSAAHSVVSHGIVDALRGLDHVVVDDKQIFMGDASSKLRGCLRMFDFNFCTQNTVNSFCYRFAAVLE